ncbi:sensor histidine kinase [Planomicrobium okeanokoites]|uniref:sensor histidine kinase n=1 Tax=Planomicrobium okeanokoites TaxID=244 RepID=UPI0024911E05|nr:HAMP domain-containing sensor histidine kinase [Planomicrobium okeanokoites]
MTIIILTLIGLFLLIRIFVYKNMVKSISSQLEDFNSRETDKKIDMALLDKDFENLGSQINRLMDSYIQENGRRIRSENELKQAIANMSHDLRTPLTSVLGYLQLLEAEDVSDEEKKDYLSIARNRTERLETLLKGFFDLSVIESPDYRLKADRVDVRRIVAATLMSFYDPLNERQVEPKITVPENSVYIMADESAVTRVVENLIANAVAYMHSDLSVTLEEKSSKVILAISNDTRNLRPEDVTYLFDRFYTADQNRSNKSTGLGLSIVKSLMLKMNGEITAVLEGDVLHIECIWE